MNRVTIKSVYGRTLIAETSGVNISLTINEKDGEFVRNLLIERAEFAKLLALLPQQQELAQSVVGDVCLDTRKLPANITLNVTGNVTITN